MKKLNDIFLKVADKVSYTMGTPANIIFWILAVLGWILLFAFNPQLQNTSFLPAWFTSNAFNFPLNTVTTLAELYIGFLVGASANRNERVNKHLADEQDKMLRLLLDDQLKELGEEGRIVKILKAVQKEQIELRQLLEGQQEIKNALKK